MRLPFLTPKAEAPNDIDAIRAKLREVESEIAIASAELDRLALQAVLTDDQSANAATDKLVAIQNRRDLLRRALAAAEQAEQDRIDALRHRDQQARRRALSQHAARLEKLARSVSQAEATLISEFKKLAETASALVATLPSHMRVHTQPWGEILSSGALRHMALLEGYRIDREHGPLLFERPPTAMEHESRADGSLPTLADRIDELTAQVRANFDCAEPAKPQSPELPTPTREPQPVTGEVCDLRGQDLGVEKKSKQMEEIANA